MSVTITSGANSTPPAGTVIATELISSEHYQRVKIALGANGAFDLVLDSGQQTMANSLPVVIASDQSALTVTDDGSFTLAANSGVDIGDVDVISIIPGTGATNLGKAADSAAGATDTGVAALAIRDDTLSALTPVEGDYVRLRTNNQGALWVEVDSAISITGTVNVNSELPAAIALNDNAANPTVPAVGNFGMVYDGATWDRMRGDSTDGVLVNLGTNNDVTIQANADVNLAQIGGTATTLNAGNADAGTQRVVIATDQAVLSVDDNAGSLTVDNAGTFAIQEDGAALTALQLLDDIVKTDDAAFTPATDKVAMVGAFFDDVTPDSVNEGDAGVVRMSANRNLYVNLRDGAGNERAANVNANSRLEISIEEDNVGIGGGTQYAVDTALGATPTGTLAIAIRDDALSALTPVEGDAIGLRVDANGALWVNHNGVLSVDDNGGSLTVDGTVTANAGTGTFTVTDDGSFTLAANSGTDIGDVDVISVIPGTGATNLGKAIDTAAGATDTGIAPLAIRDDTLTTLTPIDGDYVPLRTNTRGALWVEADSVVSVDDNGGSLTVDVGTALPAGTNLIGDVIVNDIEDGAGDSIMDAANDAMRVNVVAGGGTGGTSHVDDSAFTVGTNNVTPVGYLADETTPDSVNEGDVGVARMTLSRKPYAVITDATSENNAAVDGSGHLQVDIAADSVGIGGGTQYAVDTALGATPTGTLAIAIRDDALSALTPVEGDAIGLRVDANGALWVNHNGVLSIDDNGGSLTVDNSTLAVTGGGVEASALRVTIANDSTGVLSVDDNAGSLTVDNAGTFAIQEDGAALTALQLIDDIVKTDDTAFTPATDKVAMIGATFDDVTPDSVDEGDAGAVRMSGNRNLYVNLRDGAGNERAANVNANSRLEISIEEDNVGIGGGTQYAVDTALGATPTGTLAIAIRDDALSALTPVEGDAIGLRVDANGALWMKHNGDITIADGGNVISVDDAGGSLTIDGTVTANAGTGTFTVTDDGSFTLAANSGVDIGDVDILSIIPGTGATNLGKAVDTAAGATDTGIAPLAIRDDALATLTPIDGDYTNFRTNNRGALWIEHDGVLSIDDNGGSLTVDNSTLAVTGGGTEATAMRVTIANDSTGVVSVDDNGGSLTIDGTVTASNTAGDIAHDSADSGNPVKIGAVAKETDGTDPGSVAENDRTDLRADRNGRLLVNDAHPNMWDVRENNATSQTNNEIKAAPGAGLRLYVTDIIMSTDTAGNIKLVEDTGGTPVDRAGPFYFAANGGISAHFRTPIKIAVNTNLGYTSSMTGNHTIQVHGYIAP